MNPFEYVQVENANEAVALLNEGKGKSRIIAGGLDLLGELKEHLIEPQRLISIGDMGDMNYIKENGDRIQIGAATTISAIAEDKTIQKNHAALSQSASVVGSPQIRNVGTLGGNLCQRPRCWYYRGEFYHCLKKGWALCYAVSGRNKYHAILGGTPCFIVHPSDCAPALVALGAKISLLGPEGLRTILLEEFFSLPSETLHAENRLQPNEIVTEVEVPLHSYKSVYMKYREKEGFDWAVTAVAAALELENETCKKANLILGGVAPVPWRARKAEAVLVGQKISEELARQAGELAVEGAEPLSDNAYKIPLTKNLVKEALLKSVA